MSLLEQLQNWSFDLWSAILTIILLPILYALAIAIKRTLKEAALWLWEFIVFRVGHRVRPNLAWAITLKDFCRLRLAEENRYLHVPSHADIKLEIDKAYVPLALEEPGTDKTAYNDTSILSIGNRLRVVGDPGSGKSSLVKKLFRDACRRALSASGKAKFPILVELRKLEIPQEISASSLGGWLLQHMRMEAAASRSFRAGECFDIYAQTHGLLVLLDGLDEVASTNYMRIRQAIDGLADLLSKKSENNTILLTMRLQFHQQVKDQFRHQYGPVLFLKPFSPADIYDFLSKWPLGTQAEQSIARIYNELSDLPTLREMCSNPLILSMYVADFQSGRRLSAPESRTEFYKKVVDELLIRRRMQQIGPMPAYTTLRDQRQRILGRLAFEHMINKDEQVNTLSWQKALDITREVTQCSEEVAVDRFRELAKETGIVSEERPGQSLRFIHLTLCEFLAATEAIEGVERGWRRLLSTHKRFQNSDSAHLATRLVEIIPFAAGTMVWAERGKALTDAMRLKHPALTSRCFLETKFYEHEEWPEYVRTQAASFLATPEDQWDALWLQQLHLFSALLQDALRCATHSPKIRASIEPTVFYKELVLRQRNSLTTLINAYASQDAVAALRLAEMCSLDLAAQNPEIIMRHMDQLPLIDKVIAMAKSDLATTVRWAEILCEAGLRSPAVARMLSKRNEVPEWKVAAFDAEKRGKWVSERFMGDSLFKQCLRIAMGNVSKSTPCDFALCIKLSGLLSPAKTVGHTGSTPLVMLGIGMLAIVPSEVGVSVVPFYVAMLVFMFFYLYALRWLARSIVLKSIYRDLFLGLRGVSSILPITMKPFALRDQDSDSYLDSTARDLESSSNARIHRRFVSVVVSPTARRLLQQCDDFKTLRASLKNSR